MKKAILKKILTLSLIITLFGTSFSSIVTAEETEFISPEEAIEIEQMAEQLQFIFEEATTIDRFGVAQLDFQMIETEYGSTDLLTYFKQELVGDRLRSTSGLHPINPDGVALDRCINKKIVNAYKEVLTVLTTGTIITYITSRQYMKAASLLIKIGIRGNITGIAAQLSYYFFTCLWTTGGWTGKSSDKM